MADDDWKKAQRELKESAQKIWLAGLGALSVAEEEGTRMFDNLVDRGRSWEGKGKEKMEEARAKVHDAASGVEDRIDEKVSSALRRFGVPSREEIRELTLRVEELNAKIERMTGGDSSGG
jgi:poly(hydroxyalkanoate) granule-associated protein